MYLKMTGKNQKGSVLVEMAFVMPVLALMLIGIIDLGLIVNEHQILQNAAREGARFSSLNQMSMSGDPTGIELAIKQFVVNYALEENISININDVSVNQVYSIPDGCGSEIIVTYTRPLLVLGRPFLQLGSITLTGRVVFHNLFGC
jgi:Flp pilus assembly protein TadG